MVCFYFQGDDLSAFWLVSPLSLHPLTWWFGPRAICRPSFLVDFFGGPATVIQNVCKTRLFAGGRLLTAERKSAFGFFLTPLPLVTTEAMEATASLIPHRPAVGAGSCARLHSMPFLGAAIASGLLRELSFPLFDGSWALS